MIYYGVHNVDIWLILTQEKAHQTNLSPSNMKKISILDLFVCLFFFSLARLLSVVPIICWWHFKMMNGTSRCDRLFKTVWLKSNVWLFLDFLCSVCCYLRFSLLQFFQLGIFVGKMMIRFTWNWVHLSCGFDQNNVCCHKVMKNYQ